MRLQFWHLLVLFLVVLLLFGANRLPDLAQSVGKSLKIFKSEVKDLRDEPTPTAPPVPPLVGPAPTPGSASTVQDSPPVAHAPEPTPQQPTVPPTGGTEPAGR